MTPTTQTAPVPARHTMALTTVTLSTTVQQRADWNMATYAAYKELYEEGHDLGALTVFYDVSTGQFLLTDGYHRHAAATDAGLTTLPVDVYDGTYRHALLWATSHNLHGMPLTNRDKRKRVTTLLEDSEWSQWSDNQIAQHCGLSQAFVSSLRRSLKTVLSEDDAPAPSTRTYTNRYGTISTMHVGKIGRTASVLVENECADTAPSPGVVEVVEGAADASPQPALVAEMQEPAPPVGAGAITAPPIFTEMADAETPAVSRPPRPTSGTYEWYTPEWLVKLVRRAFGGTIDCDPASSHLAQQTVDATVYYTLADDGLSHPWYGKNMLNPPYASQAIEPWLGKLVHELAVGHTTEAILITNAATEVDWFQWIAPQADRICFPDGRINFIPAPGADSSNNSYASAILYFGPNWERFRDVFRTIGMVMIPECAKDSGPQLTLADAQRLAARVEAPATLPATRGPGTIADQLLEALRAEPSGLTDVQLATGLGTKPTDVRFAISRLITDGRVRQIGTTKTYRLVEPKEPP